MYNILFNTRNVMKELIQKTILDLNECLAERSEKYSNLHGDQAANQYWNDLEENIKFNFLLSYIEYYFYYVSDDYCGSLESPTEPKMTELEKMNITFLEFRIIIRMILDKSISGTSVFEDLVWGRIQNKDDEFKQELMMHPRVSPFMAKQFTIDLINEHLTKDIIHESMKGSFTFNDILINKVKSHKELIAKLQFIIHCSYGYFILDQKKSTVLNEVNKNFDKCSVFKHYGDFPKKNDYRIYLEELINLKE